MTTIKINTEVFNRLKNAVSQYQDDYQNDRVEELFSELYENESLELNHICRSSLDIRSDDGLIESPYFTGDAIIKLHYDYYGIVCIVNK